MDDDFDDPTATAVAHPLTLRMIDQLGNTLPTTADLEYRVGDPYAVSLAFDTDAGVVRWSFSRELMLQGLYEPAGEGDVQLWPCLDTQCRAVTMIELRGTGGEALVEVHSRDVRRFLDASYAAVAAGAETAEVDLDEAIGALLEQ